ncbi:MAG: carboxypeptidase regulatory-like domain-containing protein [Gemmatimonadota bacterium]|nr:carboxypeptidase regulatory-like domain-containing protein [Gemmatimonadota bacterium]
MRIAPLFLIAAAVVPIRGTAQPVSGIVLEEGSGKAVPGAMVLLYDSADTRVDRTLTNAAGRFIVQAGAPGSYRITVQRIGYVDWSTGHFRPEAGGMFLTIAVPFEAISLEGLDVSGARRCETNLEEGAATARVWEEARKALAAEVYTRERGLYRYTLLRYRRQLDRNARKILDEKVEAWEHLREPYVSHPIERLLTWGFVEPSHEDNMYYAPDAGTFLSEAFLETHCFGLREGEGGRIGLTFEPLPDRKVAEIKGVLWLNAATSELEQLEFLYQNILQHREVGKPGGEVSFTRLPNGAWIVREWAVRGPKLEQVIRGRLRRVGYTEEGGITWAITDADGKTILHAESATIQGVVTDSVRTGPPAGPVVVEVRETDFRAVTEEDGSFLLTGVEEGVHLLTVQHPLLSEWGLASPAMLAAEAGSGQVTYVRLRVPTVTEVLDATCGGAPRPGETTAFLGRITSPGGAARQGMTVTASWALASGYTVPSIAAPAGPEGTGGRDWTIGRDGASATATTTTDRRGLFLLCDVPHGLDLLLTVRSPGRTEPVAAESVTVNAGVGAVVEELVIPAGSEEQEP